MISEVHANRLAQAAQLAQSGHKPEAAQLCRQIVVEAPDYTAAWLWLAYSSTVQPEVADALTRAQRLEPANPAVIQAVEWYKSFVPPEKAVPLTSPQIQLADLKFTPLGPPVKESSNILMTQSGGILLVALAFFLGSLGIAVFLLGVITGIIPSRPVTKADATGNMVLNIIFLVITVGITILSGIFFFRSVQDLSTPPIRATGTILGQKRLKLNVRNRYGRIMYTDYTHEISFQSDNDNSVTTLTLSESQYLAVQLHHRAFVIYGRKLKNVRVYQRIA